jgi:aryl-alcohol dehydrogenase-like predicted oxidoreductase
MFFISGGLRGAARLYLKRFDAGDGRGYDAAAMLPGKATAAGTARYRERFAPGLARDHFIHAGGLWLSSVGLGTYLGEPTGEDDRAYEGAVIEALRGGCNILDSAINYRCQRSERSVGRALAAAVGGKKIARDEVVLATKGGFIPFDGGFPSDPRAWVVENFLRPGLIEVEDVVADCHCMAPGFIDHQFEASRRNLGVESIDIYYLHNPETQLQSVGRDIFLTRLREAFTVLEKKNAEGKLGMYGTATWDGYRLPPGREDHLSLAEVMEAAALAATEAGSDRHHFGAVQLPLNLAMLEALTAATQRPAGSGKDAPPIPFLEAAAGAGLIVMASATLLQGHLLPRIREDLADQIPGGRTGAHKAIQWVRSAPGLTTALVGMRSADHVRENLSLAVDPRMSAEQHRALLSRRS